PTLQSWSRCRLDPRKLIQADFGQQWWLRMNGARTRWLLVWALIFAGIVAAFQIGKAPIAIPLIRQELGLSLTFAAWIIGVYAVVGALAGLPAGAVINFIGARRCVVIGLVVLGWSLCLCVLIITGVA